jgi:hypothetical protein
LGPACWINCIHGFDLVDPRCKLEDEEMKELRGENWRKGIAVC